MVQPRRTQASNLPGQDGTAGSTAQARRRLIIDGTSARWTWRAPPCARALIRARAGPASLKLRVDGVHTVPRRCVILWRRWRAGCRESTRYCGGDGVRGAESAHSGPCSSRASTCAAATRRSRRASQLVWFRRLFVVFSAYTYANRLVVIE